MILAIFGAVAIVGTLGAGTAIIINGPVKIMANVNQTSQTQSQLMVASKMIMLDVDNQATGNDCDSDRITEPREWRDAAGAGPDGVAGSDGGGFLPYAIGASKRDAWGTQYGYCVWDHGALIDDPSCITAPAISQNRLTGLNSIDHPVVAIISAGRNRTFETGCLDFATADANSDGDINDTDEALITPAGDDVVSIYSYAEAAQDNPGLWQLGLNADGEAVAILDPTIGNVQFNAPSTTTGSTSFGGNLELLTTAGEIPGMNIPTQAALPTCDSMMDGEIRINTAGADPIAEICKDPGGGYDWTPLGTGGASLSATLANALADPVFDASLGNCIKNEGGPAQLIASETTRSYNIVATNGDYIFATSSSDNHVYVYTFDGQNFTAIDNAFIGDRALWTQGELLVGGNNDGTNGLRHYKINSDGTLFELSTADGSDTGNSYSLWGRENYFFAGNSSRIDGYYYDGDVINQIATGPHNSGAGMWGDDKNIYSYDNVIRALELNGSEISELDTQSSFNFNRDLSGDMNFFYVADQERIASYKFDGSDIIRLDSKVTPDSARRVYADGTHVYVGDNGNLEIYKVNSAGILTPVESLDTPGSVRKVSSDGRFLYVPSSTGLHAYAGYSCIEAIVPNQRDDYIAQITVEQPADAGTTLDSVGWAQGHNGATGTGVSMTVKANASGSSHPSASILANHNYTGSTTSLAFSTRDKEGNFNKNVLITKDAELTINPYPVDAEANIQIGNRQTAWNTDYQMGLMAVTSDGFDRGGYFGFEGESDASNVILFTEELSIKKTDIIGRNLIEFVKFESTLATTFFGDLLVKGDSVATALKNNSYSAVAGNGGFIDFKRSRGSRGTEETVADGDILGAVTMQASKGVGLHSGKASIKTIVDGVVAAGDVPVDLALSTSQANFDSEQANCKYNPGGPFAEVASFEAVDGSRAVWGDGRYIYEINSNNNNVRAFDFDGTKFTLIATALLPGSGSNRAIWGDGRYIYAASQLYGIYAYEFDGVSFTLAGHVDPPGNQRSIWGDGQYIFNGLQTGVLGVYTFDGTNFTFITSDSSLDVAVDIWGDGDYIYVADDDNDLRVFGLGGIGLTPITSASFAGQGRAVWGDGDYIYVGTGAGELIAYTFDGATLTLEGTTSLSLEAKDIWGDGKYIYVSDDATGIKAYSFDGTTFTLADSSAIPSTPDGIWGDGDYLYVADEGFGLRTFSGFGCLGELRLKESGDIGINKKEPETKLHVGGRTLSTKGIRIDNDTSCSAAEDYGTIRYTGSAADPYEVCTDGSGWVSTNLNKPADPILIDCDPLPFDLNNILGATDSTEYTTNGFIIGGLPDGRSCYLTASSDAASFAVNLNGADETGTIVEVTNGDVIKIKVDSGTGDSCLSTTVSLGSQTDQFTIGTGFGCYANEFYPEEGNCINNNSGTFSEDSAITLSAANDVWGDGRYIYVADDVDGIRAFSFDGTSLVQVGVFDTPGSAKQIWGDGTYIYVADNTSLKAYIFDGLTFSEQGSITGNTRTVWGDGQYIYTGVSPFTCSMNAYTFNGSTFTLAGSIGVATTCEDIHGDGNFIYVATDGGVPALRAYSFDGATFTSAGTHITADAGFGVWSDGTYVYYANSSIGLTALSFDGSTFTAINTANTPTIAMKVWGDGDHIYLANDTTGIYAYTFNGTVLTQEHLFNTPGNAQAVWGNGTTLFAADLTGGVRAYSGFECLATD